MATAKIILFKKSGKWYTDEEWTIPENAIGPWDMVNAPEFHTIGKGYVMVPEQEPWGYPYLIIPNQGEIGFRGPAFDEPI